MTGAQFRQIRRTLDYTQQQLADMLGVTRQTIHVWERREGFVPEYIAIAVSTFRPRLYTMSEKLTHLTSIESAKTS